MTDGRFSGATHGIMVGHVCPEAHAGGPLTVVRDGDTITIDLKHDSVSARDGRAKIKARFITLRVYGPIPCSSIPSCKQPEPSPEAHSFREGLLIPSSFFPLMFH